MNKNKYKDWVNDCIFVARVKQQPGSMSLPTVTQKWLQQKWLDKDKYNTGLAVCMVNCWLGLHSTYVKVITAL
jgi:hypothetical protein